MVEMWQRKMMPLVRKRGSNEIVTLAEDFERLMTLVGIGVDDQGRPLQADAKEEAYQRELLGARVIESAPLEYWDALTMIEANAIGVWDSLPVKTRAKVKAAMRIKNMAAVIEKHRDIQAARMKKKGLGTL